MHEGLHEKKRKLHEKSRSGERQGRCGIIQTTASQGRGPRSAARRREHRPEISAAGGPAGTRAPLGTSGIKQTPPSGPSGPILKGGGKK